MLRRSSLALLVFLAGGLAVSGAPLLKVHVGNTPVGVTDRGGVDAIDFGAAPVAVEVAKNVTVTNTGTESVTLRSPIKTPLGFTVQRLFETNTLAPGRSTTFVLALNSSLAGPLSGRVTFETSAGTASIPVRGVAFGPPALRIVKAGDPGFRTTGRWTLAGAVAQAAPAGKGAALATWTFTGLVPGQYRVATTWNADARLASNARFTVLNDTTPFTPVAVNQKDAPADFRDAGTGWKTLGTYTTTADTLAVRLSDRADGAVLADAVRIERVGFPGRIVEITDSGFRTSGSWAVSGDGAFRGRQMVAAGGSNAQAAWTITGLVPGQYRVSTAWQPINGGGTGSFTILDGNRPVTSVELRQTRAPRDLHDGGLKWQDLGGTGRLFSIRGDTLTVKLHAERSAGAVTAGLVRVERVYNPMGSTGPEGTSMPDIVRLLEQSTWGANDALIAQVQGQGISGFVLDQIYNQTPSSYPTLPLVPGSRTTLCGTTTTPGYNTCIRENYTVYLLQNQFFVNAFYGPDQLIQRTSWAWHKIMVASAQDNQIQQGSHFAPYLQIFDTYGLGNYRDLLYNLTLNGAMGRYLNMEGSTKNNPNENYAREIMQLFSIGLVKLNPNGTVVIDPMTGQPVRTFVGTDVTAYAKAFTGWSLARPPQTGVQNFIDPMIVRTPQTTYHDRTAKTLLNGVQVPANTDTAVELGIAIDSLANHDNVAPFISQQFIQQLVTSNPTPAYVMRISQQFTNTGGDLAQMVYNILLDAEARGDSKGGAMYGKLREPVQYINNVARAFNPLSFDQTTYSDGYLTPQATPMAQNVFKPDSVFSYFSPFKTIPDSTVLMPELQILDATTALKRYNYVQVMANPNGAVGADGIKPTTPPPPPPDRPIAPVGTKLDFSVLTSMAGDPNAMLDYLNGLMLHGTLTAQNRTSIVTAINAVAASNPLRRAKVAVYLVATSSQYQVQR